MKTIFIYNAESGSGKICKYKDYILQRLSTKFGNVECLQTTHAGHAFEFARENAEKYDYFFVSGGDGTLNEIVNGIAPATKKPILGYIPTGTVNDVAHSLKISRNVKKAVDNILYGTPFAHDIFKINDKYGIYVCCAGLFTQCSYATARKNKKALGKLAYFIKGAKEIFITKPVQVTLKTQNETISHPCSMVLILNSKSAAGFAINKKAELDDGVVEVVLVHSHTKRIKLFDIIRTMRIFLFGLDSVKKNKHLTYRKLANFSLKTSDGTDINMDGERRWKGSFNFEVINKGIQIITGGKNEKRS